MNEHVLITALKAAGPMTAKVAHTLTVPHYNPTGISAVSWLADALIEDLTGKSALNDKWVLEDRDASREARAASRDLREKRVKIAIALDKFPTEYRDHLYRELAAGRGATEATALQTAADTQLRRALDSLAEASAVAAS